MKKTLLFIATFTAVASLSKAQSAIPNAGMENWKTKGDLTHSYEDPTGWVTTNQLYELSQKFYTDVFVTKSTTKHSGTYSARLETKKLTPPPPPTAGIPDTLAGILTVGDSLVNAFGGPEFGINKKPSAFTAFYGYTPGASTTGAKDSALFFISAYFKGTQIGGGIAKVGQSAPGQAIKITVPINYQTADIPDSMGILILSGDINFQPGAPTNATPGSVLYVDDLDFEYAVQAVTEIANPYSVSAYPNPAKDALTISLNNIAANTIRVIDIAGRVRQALPIDGLSKINLNATDLASGIYFYQLIDTANKVLFTGKFSVAK